MSFKKVLIRIFFNGELINFSFRKLILCYNYYKKENVNYIMFYCFVFISLAVLVIQLSFLSLSKNVTKRINSNIDIKVIEFKMCFTPLKDTGTKC